MNAPRFYASGSELSILRLSASLAGSQSAASLQDLTSGLDVNNAGLVLEAIAHRWGWHERQQTRTVTGRFPGGPSRPAGRAPQPRVPA